MIFKKLMGHKNHSYSIRFTKEEAEEVSAPSGTAVTALRSEAATRPIEARRVILISKN